ncbi:hypothetical protein SEA_BIG4_100 [Microbacterium phage Big4]|nr:hypothetical protein SEA_BIG4_100 [Microbacterium phage Big4]
MTSTNWLDLLADAKANGGSQDFGPVPAGPYKFKILEAETRQTQTGKTKYTIKAQIQEGPYANRLVWDDLIVSPDSAAAMGFFFRKMKAIGLDEQFFGAAPNDDQITAALKDREFLGNVKIESFGGKDRNKIDGYKPLSAAPQGFIPPAPQAASAAPAAPVPTAAPAPAPQAAPAPAAPAQAPAAAPWDQGAPAAAPAPAAPAPAAGDPWSQPAAPAPAAPAPGAPSFPQPPF